MLSYKLPDRNARVEHRQKEPDDFTHADHVVDEALEWLLKLEAQPDDTDVRVELNAWLSRCPEHRAEFEQLLEVRNSSAFHAALRKAASGMHAVERKRGAALPTRTVMARNTKAILFVGFAACLTLLCLQLPTILIQFRSDFVTGTGEQARIDLPDGSTMLLNTASAAAIDFSNGHRRVVLLKGEAFFDVVHDADHPFQVAGQFGQAVVKGTAFAVRTDDDLDRITLERGLVTVTRLEGSGEADLHPGEEVVVDATRLSGVSKVDPERSLAWRDGRISFFDRPVRAVVDDLARYYPGVIIIARENVARTKVTGNLRLNDTENALRSVAEAAGATLTRLPGGVMIFR